MLSEDSAQRATDQIVAEAGGHDVVVHNAAHLLVGVTEAFSPEEVLHAFDVNAMGALRVNCAALPVLRAQDSGPPAVLLLWIGQPADVWPRLE